MLFQRIPIIRIYLKTKKTLFLNNPICIETSTESKLNIQLQYFTVHLSLNFHDQTLNSVDDGVMHTWRGPVGRLHGHVTHSQCRCHLVNHVLIPSFVPSDRLDRVVQCVDFALSLFSLHGA